MSKARLVITALFIEQQSPAEVAARYGVHRSWVYQLKAGPDTISRYLAKAGMAVPVRFAGIRRQGGPHAFDHELRRLHVTQNATTRHANNEHPNLLPQIRASPIS